MNGAGASPSAVPSGRSNRRGSVRDLSKHRAPAPLRCRRTHAADRRHHQLSRPGLAAFISWMNWPISATQAIPATFSENTGPGAARARAPDGQRPHLVPRRSAPARRSPVAHLLKCSAAPCEDDQTLRARVLPHKRVDAKSPSTADANETVLVRLDVPKIHRAGTPRRRRSSRLPTSRRKVTATLPDVGENACRIGAWTRSWT